MALAQYFTEFIFYSFLGWIWESIYCSAKEKKWADRGFLFGPICPIYGLSAVIASMVFTAVPILRSPEFPLWAIFLLCAFSSAGAEYFTSWFLEKRFHARWWDYSDTPLNINGRICIPASAGFGLAGIAILKYLIPAVDRLHMMINPTIYEVLSLFFAMLLGADIALTEASLSSLLKNLEDMHAEFNEKAQLNYERIAAVPKVIASAPKVIAQAPKAIAQAPKAIANAPKAIAQAPKVIGEKIQMLPYLRKLSFGQKRVLGKVKIFMPDEHKTEAQNRSRLAFWQNLKEAAGDFRLRKRDSKDSIEEAGKDPGETQG